MPAIDFLPHQPEQCASLVYAHAPCFVLCAGATHIVRPEDFPVMPVETVSLHLLTPQQSAPVSQALLRASALVAALIRHHDSEVEVLMLLSIPCMHRWAST